MGSYFINSIIFNGKYPSKFVNKLLFVLLNKSKTFRAISKMLQEKTRMVGVEKNMFEIINCRLSDTEMYLRELESFDQPPLPYEEGPSKCASNHYPNLRKPVEMDTHKPNLGLAVTGPISKQKLHLDSSSKIQKENVTFQTPIIKKRSTKFIRSQSCTDHQINGKLLRLEDDTKQVPLTPISTPNGSYFHKTKVVHNYQKADKLGLPKSPSTNRIICMKNATQQDIFFNLNTSVLPQNLISIKNTRLGCDTSEIDKARCSKGIIQLKHSKDPNFYINRDDWMFINSNHFTQLPEIKKDSKLKKLIAKKKYIPSNISCKIPANVITQNDSSNYKLQFLVNFESTKDFTDISQMIKDYLKVPNKSNFETTVFTYNPEILKLIENYLKRVPTEGNVVVLHKKKNHLRYYFIKRKRSIQRRDKIPDHRVYLNNHIELVRQIQHFNQLAFNKLERKVTQALLLKYPELATPKHIHKENSKLFFKIKKPGISFIARKNKQLLKDFSSYIINMPGCLPTVFADTNINNPVANLPTFDTFKRPHSEYTAICPVNLMRSRKNTNRSMMRNNFSGNKMQKRSLYKQFQNYRKNTLHVAQSQAPLISDIQSTPIVTCRTLKHDTLKTQTQIDTNQATDNSPYLNVANKTTKSIKTIGPTDETKNLPQNDIKEQTAVLEINKKTFDRMENEFKTIKIIKKRKVSSELQELTKCMKHENSLILRTVRNSLILLNILVMNSSAHELLYCKEETKVTVSKKKVNEIVSYNATKLLWDGQEDSKTDTNIINPDMLNPAIVSTDQTVDNIARSKKDETSSRNTEIVNFINNSILSKITVTHKDEVPFSDVQDGKEAVKPKIFNLVDHPQPSKLIISNDKIIASSKATDVKQKILVSQNNVDTAKFFSNVGDEKGISDIKPKEVSVETKTIDLANTKNEINNINKDNLTKDHTKTELVNCNVPAVIYKNEGDIVSTSETKTEKELIETAILNIVNNYNAPKLNWSNEKEEVAVKDEKADIIQPVNNCTTQHLLGNNEHATISAQKDTNKPIPEVKLNLTNDHDSHKSISNNMEELPSKETTYKKELVSNSNTLQYLLTKDNAKVEMLVLDNDRRTYQLLCSEKGTSNETKAQIVINNCAFHKVDKTIIEKKEPKTKKEPNPESNFDEHNKASTSSNGNDTIESIKANLEYDSEPRALLCINNEANDVHVLGKPKILDSENSFIIPNMTSNNKDNISDEGDKENLDTENDILQLHCKKRSEAVAVSIDNEEQDLNNDSSAHKLYCNKKDIKVTISDQTDKKELDSENDTCTQELIHDKDAIKFTNNKCNETKGKKLDLNISTLHEILCIENNESGAFYGESDLNKFVKADLLDSENDASTQELFCKEIVKRDEDILNCDSPNLLNSKEDNCIAEEMDTKESVEIEPLNFEHKVTINKDCNADVKLESLYIEDDSNISELIQKTKENDEKQLKMPIIAPKSFSEQEEDINEEKEDKQIHKSEVIDLTNKLKVLHSTHDNAATNHDKNDNSKQLDCNIHYDKQEQLTINNKNAENYWDQSQNFSKHELVCKEETVNSEKDEDEKVKILDYELLCDKEVEYDTPNETSYRELIIPDIIDLINHYNVHELLCNKANEEGILSNELDEDELVTAEIIDLVKHTDTYKLLHNKAVEQVNQENDLINSVKYELQHNKEQLNVVDDHKTDETVNEIVSEEIANAKNICNTSDLLCSRDNEIIVSNTINNEKNLIRKEISSIINNLQFYVKLSSVVPLELFSQSLPYRSAENPTLAVLKNFKVSLDTIIQSMFLNNYSPFFNNLESYIQQLKAQNEQKNKLPDVTITRKPVRVPDMPSSPDSRLVPIFLHNELPLNFKKKLCVPILPHTTFWNCYPKTPLLFKVKENNDKQEKSNLVRKYRYETKEVDASNGTKVKITYLVPAR